MDATYLAALAVAMLAHLSVFALVLGVFAHLEELRRRREIMGRTLGLSPEDKTLRRPGVVGWLATFFTTAAVSFGRKVKPTKAEDISATRATLMHAGFRGQNAVEFYWGIKIGMALAGIGLAAAVILVVAPTLRPEYKFLIGAGTVSAFFYAPGLVLNHLVNKRQRAIQNGLPDALDLLVVCVEAGMGLDGAMQRVGMELAHNEPVLSSELKLLTLELRAGKSRREALKNLATRVGLEDVGSLVALLIQADMFGTSIAQTLRVYADAMRTKRFQRAEEIAAKLPVKLLLPLVFFIFPTLLMIILGPAAIRLMAMFAQTAK
ncbi:MAG: type II secretion system F family protein [Desulfovibrionaceae bacterium]|nr:type II secretion system F family protein [Desulfovibrionaceae bacterium]